MYSLLFLPTELTKNIIAGRVYNYIQDEDKKLIERHVVAPYLLPELTRNNIAAHVYNYIRDEDKGKERYVVTPLFPDRTDQEHGSRPVSTTTFEMKTSKRRRENKKRRHVLGLI